LRRVVIFIAAIVENVDRYQGHFRPNLLELKLTGNPNSPGHAKHRDMERRV